MSDHDGDRSIRRRSLLKTIGAGALASGGALAASGAATADGSDDYYHNPLYTPHFPDPSVVRADDGTYYAYGTNMNRDDDSKELLTPILRSDDLVDWEYVGEAFESKPDWKDKGFLWAPEITYYNRQYYLYYSYSVWGDTNPGIGVATADTPEGPFTDRGKLFRSAEIGVPNSIDAYFRVVDGTPYLVWGGKFGVALVELTHDGLDWVRGTQRPLAGNGVEAPFVIERDGYYYLFLSAGSCCSGNEESDYHVQAARSESFFGPYHDKTGMDITDAQAPEFHTALQGNDRFTGPGHNAAIQDENGEWWAVYHAYDTETPGYIHGAPRRVLFLDRISWHMGWPVIGGDGTPSLESRVPNSGDTGIVEDSFYRIENVYSGKTMEIDSALEENGGNVQQMRWYDSDRQYWWIEYLGDGEYRAVNQNSWKVLEVPGGSTANGASLQQWDWSALPRQKWAIVDNGDRTYRIENVETGKVADVAGSSQADGADVVQNEWDGRVSQKWRLEPLYGDPTLYFQ